MPQASAANENPRLFQHLLFWTEKSPQTLICWLCQRAQVHKVQTLLVPVRFSNFRFWWQNATVKNQAKVVLYQLIVRYNLGKFTRHNNLPCNGDQGRWYFSLQAAYHKLQEIQWQVLGLSLTSYLQSSSQSYCPSSQPYRSECDFVPGLWQYPHFAEFFLPALQFQRPDGGPVWGVLPFDWAVAVWRGTGSCSKNS